MKSMQNSHNLLIQEQLGKSKISFGFAYITFFLLIEYDTLNKAAMANLCADRTSINW